MRAQFQPSTNLPREFPGHFVLSNLAIADHIMWIDNQEERAVYDLSINTNDKVAITSLNSKNIICVAAGDNYSLALSKEGVLYAWGNNNYGQLGLGHRNSCPEPQIIETLSEKKIVWIASNCFSNLALASDGTLYTWGNNLSGQLGLGHKNPCYVPAMVPQLERIKIKQIALGVSHSLALAEDGSVYAWGSNSSALGRGIDDGYISIKPFEITELKNKKVIYLTAGNGYSLAVTEDNTVYAWGYNNVGQLGLGFSSLGLDSSSDNIYSPQEVKALRGKKIISLVSGWAHNLAQTVDGTVFAWGGHDKGQLGVVQNKYCYDLPQEVIELRHKDISRIAASKYTSIAFSRDSIYIFGESHSAFLVRDRVQSYMPRLITTRVAQEIARIINGPNKFLSDVNLATKNPPFELTDLVNTNVDEPFLPSTHPFEKKDNKTANPYLEPQNRQYTNLTNSVSSYSQIDNRHIISDKGWVLSLVRIPKASSEHAFIVVEGYESEQYFLWLTDFVLKRNTGHSSEMLGKGKVRFHEYKSDTPKGLIYESKISLMQFKKEWPICSTTLSILADEATLLRENILTERDSKTFPEYCVFGDGNLWQVTKNLISSTEDKRHNCFTWARAHINKVVNPNCKIADDDIRDLIGARTSNYLPDAKNIQNTSRFSFWYKPPVAAAIGAATTAAVAYGIKTNCCNLQ